MNLGSFISMWQNDGFELTEHERVEKKDVTWFLYTTLSREFTDDYGRHFALTLAVDKRGEILAHDSTNLRDSTNPTRATIDWFHNNILGGIPV